jgi:hypothetical protein
MFTIAGGILLAGLIALVGILCLGWVAKKLLTSENPKTEKTGRVSATQSRF